MAWSEAGTVSRVQDDADGFGHVAGTAAMREAVALASSHGVGPVLVRLSHRSAAETSPPTVERPPAGGSHAPADASWWIMPGP